MEYIATKQGDVLDMDIDEFCRFLLKGTATSLSSVRLDFARRLFSDYVDRDVETLAGVWSARPGNGTRGGRSTAAQAETDFGLVPKGRATADQLQRVRPAAGHTAIRHGHTMPSLASPRAVQCSAVQCRASRGGHDRARLAQVQQMRARGEGMDGRHAAPLAPVRPPRVTAPGLGEDEVHRYHRHPVSPSA
jgi:hypothetical protein